MHIRRAEQRDSLDLLTWRNDAATRAASLNTAEVTREDHDRWYETALQNPLLVLFIVENEEQTDSVGMCRFNLDLEVPQAEVSINLNPAFRGKGLAQTILSESLSLFSQEYPHIHELTATIREENAPSIKIFRAAGFVDLSSHEGILELHRVTA